MLFLFLDVASGGVVARLQDLSGLDQFSADDGLKTGLGSLGGGSNGIGPGDEILIKNGCIVSENREK
jgi:hypothetical protein